MTTLADERLNEEHLRQVLARTLGCPAFRIVVVLRQRLKSGVYRLQLEVQGTPRSVIVKRLAPEIAVRNRLVVERWLPAENMQHVAAPLLGIVAETLSTWLVSEDLGTRTLQAVAPDPVRVEAAVALIAGLHRRFVDNALLGEVRHWGGDLGMRFHEVNLRDALRALAALRDRLDRAVPERTALCERLLARLGGLQQDAPRRAEAMQRWGGPETLLHGDLWPTNVVEVARGTDFEPRLIDWDHVGVGPPVYDVSTFLYRFEPRERRRVWAAYQDAFGSAPWRFPGEAELAFLCETAEQARFSNRVLWLALAALRGDDWGFEELAEVEGWFEHLAPLLP